MIVRTLKIRNFKLFKDMTLMLNENTNIFIDLISRFGLVFARRLSTIVIRRCLIFRRSRWRLIAGMLVAEGVVGRKYEVAERLQKRCTMLQKTMIYRQI